MNARFYAPAARADAVVALPADEARHLARVLRLRPGDAVVVFDGHGAEFEATVAQIGGDRVDVRVGASRVAVPEPGVAITLAQAVLKGDKMDDVVRDAVMIGAAAIQPVVSARSEIAQAALQRGHRRERWERIAVSSAKQCARAVVPRILDPIDAGALPAVVSARQLPAPAFLLVEPSATDGTAAVRGIDAARPREATVVIGPEGGWTREEIEALAGVCRPVTMGARTIRADAMAIVAIAALFTRWNEW